MLETLPMWSNVQPQLQPHLDNPLTLGANVLEIAAAQVPRGSCRKESSANKVLSTIGVGRHHGYFVVRNLLLSSSQPMASPLSESENRTRPSERRFNVNLRKAGLPTSSLREV
jgi:hypothetical protein